MLDVKDYEIETQILNMMPIKNKITFKKKNTSCNFFLLYITIFR